MDVKIEFEGMLSLGIGKLPQFVLWHNLKEIAGLRIEIVRFNKF